MSDEPLQVGVVCGVCDSGPVYFETCDLVEDHYWAIASECQNCGERYEIAPCTDCTGELGGTPGDQP